MKALLLYKHRDFDLEQPLPWNAPALTQDLELRTLFDAMAAGDELLLKVVERVVFSSLDSCEAILYRQHILQDCIKNPDIVNDINAIAIEAVEVEREHFRWLSSFVREHPSLLLSSSVETLETYVGVLKKLRAAAQEYAGKFESDGFTRFFRMLEEELSDDYLAELEESLRILRFQGGVPISAELGIGNKGTNHVLRKLPGTKQGWLSRILAEKPLGFSVHPRDVAGADALRELKDRGLNLAANVVTLATDHIHDFFHILRTELAFYLGCLNLQTQLAKRGKTVSFPQPAAARERRHSYWGLYNAALALTTQRPVVGNDVNADGKDLVIITGANQGGKSTFLQSIGLAQLMMQCGMFVPAESFHANISEGLFTHYRRKEDTAMTSGKLDEELKRMSDIVDNLEPDSLILFNESFAATNEREGSEIVRQITSALLEKRIKVFFVTHQYEFAHKFYDRHLENFLYLRAGRRADGTRTFKLAEGEPLQTSFGKDVYHEIFGVQNE